MEYSCNDCKKKFFSSEMTDRIFDENLFYFYCAKCIKKYKLYSKTVAMKKFCLKKSLLANLKTLYIPNKGNSQKYYLQSSILEILHANYNNVDSYLQMIKERHDKLKNKQLAKKFITEERKKQLIAAFHDNKLEYNCVGDCYAYIYYGKPSIESILVKEFTKLEEQNERRKQLAEYLRQSKILLDCTVEKIPLVDNYIKYSQGNIRNIVNVVKRILNYNKITSLINPVSNNTKLHNTNLNKSIMITFD
jgi:hypothetical protein